MANIRDATSVISKIAFDEQGSNPATIATRWQLFFKAAGLFWRDPDGVTSAPLFLVQGQYEGDETSNRELTGLGITPVMVLIISDDGVNCNFYLKLAENDVNDSWDITAATTQTIDMIMNFDDGSFDIGDTINVIGVDYFYMALGYPT